MSKSPHTRFRTLAAALIASICAFALIACGSGDSSDSGAPPPDYAKKLAGSPPPLAALHKQGDEVLDGGKEAFDSRIDELEGFPKVVNVWGSWCGPCRAEFPHFQQASANLGKVVAFLGVDSNDDTASAKDFLDDHQVPYPSYSDHDKEIGNSIGVTAGIPATVFFNSEGEQTFTKFGPYTSQEELEADIRTYAIEGKGG
ncbi:MAG: TlpA family protein disulfide reductase [Thermoleophilia bacterium]|nr:TlpA family protein disulfide reductase [Thermoleophilia bacterium]